ncbi:SUPPRESSOR OF ABI3-5 [Cardamine amara subsp. amara]|uniref:SUPPRESSOR OF ABI3-5 n=1 Tax=Cardamine amara subsp. amara TaxID=228776 RepID=A0ABD1BA36_CARAN
MPDDKELQEDDSYVWDNDTQLYIHHSSGFYHDPNAGWYYCSKDGHYYKHENGEYVLLEYDESRVNLPGDIITCDPSEDDSGRKDPLAEAENVENEYGVSLRNPGETPSGCSNDQEPEHSRRPSSWVEDTLIELYLAGYKQDHHMLSANGDNDVEELEEGEWIPEEDFDPEEENFDQAVPSSEEEIWQAQYGQVIESTEKTLPEIPSVDLWDWKLVFESRKADDEQVARLVGRLVKRSANLHPSVASSGKLLKTAPIYEARLHLVRVRTGQVYKLRNPSAKYLASLSVYDSSNPTKDWGFPDISTTWQSPDTKRKAKKVKPKTDCKLTVKLSEVDMIEEETKRKAKKAKPKTDCKLIVKPRDEVNKIEEQRSCSYRDRAAERRNLHGGYGVGPGQKGTTTGLNEDEQSLADTASEEHATAEALELSFGSGSYARRIMGNMGWKEGETLGKNTKGLVEPIQAAGNTGNAGLGFAQRRRK